VVLRLSTADADMAFLELILHEEQKRSSSLPIDSLIALSVLREQKRVSRDDLAGYLQKDSASAGRTLEALLEAGLVQSHGATRGRTYTLTARVYKELGKAAEYTRQAGFDRLQQEQLVRNYVKEHGSIRRQDVMDLCRLEGPQASRLLKRLVDAEALTPIGEKRGSYYRRGSKL
ncbi:MAG: crosslink repair DNA glycosylase YcaQ family protein, partial [Mariprofundaceae bacterium]|nr:crosslink repair DNA glycosylase YcaQ family protein [Mariprofundaceae bacterium]